MHKTAEDCLENIEESIDLPLSSAEFNAYGDIELHGECVICGRQFIEVFVSTNGIEEYV